MSSPRLLVGATALALASAALPASAMAALVRDPTTPAFPTADSSATYGSQNLSYTDDAGLPATAPTSDGILVPGETANFNFPLFDNSGTDGSAPYDGTASGQLYETGSSFLSVSDPAGGSSTTRRQWTAVPGTSGQYQNSSPFRINVGAGAQCGQNIPLRLNFSTLNNQDLIYGLPTGAPSAFHTTQSYDIGQIEPDGGTADSKVKITETGLLKGLRIHIDSIQHQYSTHWLKIKLVAPDGKSALMFDQVGVLQNSPTPATKTLTNVTFSDSSVNGQAPMSAEDAETQPTPFNNVVIRPKESFSVFDGESLAGDWHLQVSDISIANEPRSGHNARSSQQGRTDLIGSQNMFQLGGWQISQAGATCVTTPNAWLDDPTFADPDGTTQLDASGSYSPVPGRTITGYAWDLNAPSSGPGNFGPWQTSPKINFGTGTGGTKRLVMLKVKDNTGAVSDVLTRQVVITKKPVFDANTTPAPTTGNMIGVDPATPKAGDTVTLAAHATDVESPDNKLVYTWDLNDDGVFTDGTGPVVTYKWTTSGPHIVRVLVTDGDGASTLYYQTVTIANLPPISKFTVTPVPAIVGQPVSLDASASSDPDGTIAEYDWDLDQSGLFQTKTTLPKSTYTFTQAGDYTIRLRVVDNTGGTDDSQVDVHVTGLPVPVASASPSSPLTGETVTFSAAGSHDSDPGGSITKYEWDLDGNGTYDVIGATATTATKSYPNAGNVTVRLRVTDNDGATNVAMLSLVVRNPSTGGQSGGSNGGSSGGTNPGTNNGGTNTTTTNPGVNAANSIPGTAAQFPTLSPDTPLQTGTDGLKQSLGTATPPGLAVAPKGFTAQIATGAKQHGSKTYKKGIAVNFKANTAGTLSVSLMVLPKYAKSVGLKLKGTKLVKIGAGKVVATKAGTYKFVVTVTKKYQGYIKRAKKLPVELRAVATSKDTGETLALGKKFTYVK